MIICRTNLLSLVRRFLESGISILFVPLFAAFSEPLRTLQKHNLVIEQMLIS